MAEVIGEGTFDITGFGPELEAAAKGHRRLGTRVLFENGAVRVWEVRLRPGERGEFHLHDGPYFWTVVQGGTGLQRSDDGTYKLREYHEGDTSFQENSPEHRMIHDFENAGVDVIRFVTVELLR